MSERVFAMTAMPPQQYADNASKIHEKLVEACAHAAAERGMTLDPALVIDVLTETVDGVPLEEDWVLVRMTATAIPEEAA